jgi:mRNA-degrading endonuclease toxin of MazEF toxin-antitoxin module
MTYSRGDICKIPLTQADSITPKDGYEQRNKLVVILGTDSKGHYYGIAVINHAINIKFANFDFQYCINVSKYPEIFTTNSYVNCSTVREIDMSRMEKSHRLGSLDTSDMDRIVHKLRECPDISKHLKKKYGLLAK